MRIEQREVYIAEDGTEFDSEEACFEYDRFRQLESYLGMYSSSFTPKEAAEFIWDKWETIKILFDGGYDND